MPRIVKLAYVALNVTDLERSHQHYQFQVGLEASGTGPGS